MEVHAQLPPEFASALKELVAWTILPPDTADMDPLIQSTEIWSYFDILGLIDRYEMLIASVCYEHIDARVTMMCARKWGEPMLPQVRAWMAQDVVGWMLKPYARGAKTSE